MEQLKERITKLEWHVEGHDEDIKALTTTSDELKKTLLDITMTLKQIKWIALGAGLVLFADQFGVTSAIKFLTI